MAFIAIAVLLVLIIGGLLFLSFQSKSGSAPGLVDGKLSACPPSPNCVSSEAGTPDSHRVEPLPLAAWEKLPEAIAEMGGDIIVRDDSYIAAEIRTPLMQFVDDVEFRKGDAAVHVRSASRVGHSDMGANKKRVEELRTTLGD